MRAQSVRYPSINGLRALSIFMVICQHENLHFQVFERFRDRPKLKMLTDFIQDGQLGVNVFFVISGFLITSLMLAEERKDKRISLKDFYIRRTLRIFPAYYFLLLVLAILQLGGALADDPILPSSWLTALTYTKYFNWHKDWWTAHAWSLSIEEHFYLLWPLVFIAGPVTRKAVAAGCILLVPLLRFYLWYHPVSWINDMTLFLKIDVIATGCLLALYQDEFLRFFGRFLAPLFYFALPALFFIKPLYEFLGSHHIDVTLPLVLLGDTHGIIANLLLAIILMYSVFGPKGLWFKALNFPLINFIGILSYSIYLWQQVFVSHLPTKASDPPQNVLFVLLAALFSYYVIERPFLKLKARFSHTKQSAEQVPELTLS